MAPKRAFGGVLRPFGGGFRGPNRERASVFSGAGRGRAGGSAVEPGRDQRVQRRGTGRCRWFCGGARRRSQRVQRRRTGAVQGVLRWSRGGASAFSGGARCGTGAEQAGVLRRRRGRGQRVQRRGIGAGRGVQRCRRDGPAAGSQKKCSEGKMRPPPGRKKSVPRGRCAAARTHTGTKKRTSVRSLLFLLHYSATLRASAPGCSSDTPCRTTTAPHSGSPSLLRETSGSMFSCNSLSAFDFGLPVGRGHSRESLRPPPGSQFSAAIRSHLSAARGLGRPQPGTQPPAPAARPLRRRGHSTTTSVWPSTCSWRISCIELT